MRRFVLSLLVVFPAVAATTGMPLASQGAAATDPHAYFNRLAARAEKLQAFSLRDQAQIDSLDGARSESNQRVRYLYGSDPYHSPQDAAKIILPGWRAGEARLPDKLGSAYQVYIPINVSSGRVLLTWDAWFGPEWPNGVSKTTGHKMYRLEGGVPDGTISTFRYYEGSKTQIAAPNLRPLFDNGGVNLPPRIGDQLKPMQDFIVVHSKWVRFWVDMDFETKPGYTTLSLWIADEDREPVPLYRDLQFLQSSSTTGIQKGLKVFRFEYDVSQDYRGKPTLHEALPDMIGYVRNFVALRNVSNPTSLLERPVGGRAGSGSGGTPAAGGTPSTRPPSPPRGVRIVP